ncbi:hypothetical protein NDI37_17035 [Funiculus sociatus GB2-A5]|uniref:Uncharacterized protein n=1 Tax=Funiculus sociatus GB2-A5 TaxID=2933946 RepID=A0ABV0JSS4_9CYAN|nr:MULTISPECIES: hypothetical protein [unclassified Trichocoleus]MBD1904329.1 hypothetical protein [Trichocoleus sp. FACHB-832]MBD2065020.1 hypothetical protein [Trichocoleus sp. FACHB-6]
MIASIFPSLRSRSLLSFPESDRFYLYQRAITFIFSKARSHSSFPKCDRIHIWESAIASTNIAIANYQMDSTQSIH